MKSSNSLRPSDFQRGDQGVPLMDYPCPSATPHPVIDEPRGRQHDSDTTGVQPVKVPDQFSTGLEHLVNVEQLSVEPGYTEAFIMSAKRKFRITNNFGEQVYWANLDLWQRKLVAELTDTSDRQIIQIRLLPTCTLCGLWCAADAVDVVSSSETQLGVIRRECVCLRPLLFVDNSKGETVLRVEFTFTGGCCSDVYSITSADGLVPLGDITRERGGSYGLQAVYKITFPHDVDVEIKALLLALCLWMVRTDLKN